MQPIKSISVSGVRSFAASQTLEPAVPNGEAPCSGLTILVGPNNGGKSTLLEAIDIAGRAGGIDIARAHRHDATDYIAEFEIAWSDGQANTVQSDEGNPQSLTSKAKDAKAVHRPVIVVGVNRELPTEVDRQRLTREDYVSQQAYAFTRRFQPERLARRMPNWRASQSFKRLLARVLDFPLRQYAEGQSAYVKVGGHEHDPRGLGYGVAALMHIIDALYDAPKGSTVLIDEPELSLHPHYQRRLLKVLVDESSRIQIIYATHSPYFADWCCVAAGAALARVAKNSSGYSEIHVLKRDTVEELAGVLGNLRNPHILGTNSSEVFFLQDGVILVEGQDDVVYYRRMADELGAELNGEFFGWGAGGAGNLPKIASVLRDLGYKHVVGVLDRTERNKVETLKRTFPEFRFLGIPTEDVRDKDESAGKACKGLCDTEGRIHEEHRESVAQIFQQMNEFLSK